MVNLNDAVDELLLPAKISLDLIMETNECESLFGIGYKNYTEVIDNFVFSKPRDYNGFRQFLEDYSGLFENEENELFAKFTNANIDYVLDQIMEERGQYLLEQGGLVE